MANNDYIEAPLPEIKNEAGATLVPASGADHTCGDEAATKRRAGGAGSPALGVLGG
ncbi:hypothetical protein LJ756_05955 [Arthrobacter sp. zg-Y411]|uniref:hypothetical protein n=1 Tax=Arthrobacter zhangbolii TaxID=2886936 RepID=UPI001D14B4DD|nr:hypothetical protein [Arthrobacter zhangbolii]MCC3294164.1 hypothetical protein [Arthrobacter zhangbolii]